MPAKRTRRRGGTSPNPALAQCDYPYTMKLADGRRVLVEVPGRWVTHDRDGSPAFLPEGVAFLDRARNAALRRRADVTGRTRPRKR